MFKRPELKPSAAPSGVATARWYTSSDRELLVADSTYEVIAQLWKGPAGDFHWNVLNLDRSNVAVSNHVGAADKRAMARYAVALRVTGFACINDPAEDSDKAAGRINDHVSACAKWTVNRIAEDLAGIRSNANSRSGELRALLNQVLAALPQHPNPGDDAEPTKVPA